MTGLPFLVRIWLLAKTWVDADERLHKNTSKKEVTTGVRADAAAWRCFEGVWLCLPDTSQNAIDDAQFANF